MKQTAIMSIENGEELAAGLISTHIPGTGRYKFLAKKKVCGNFDWAHFIERDNGMKDSFYTGTTKDEKQLQELIEIINKVLKKVYGAHVFLQPGFPEVRTLEGLKSDPVKN